MGGSVGENALFLGEGELGGEPEDERGEEDPGKPADCGAEKRLTEGEVCDELELDGEQGENAAPAGEEAQESQWRAGLGLVRSRHH